MLWYQYQTFGTGTSLLVPSPRSMRHLGMGRIPEKVERFKGWTASETLRNW